jgi:uncharacterized protein (DUF488 family)
MMDDQQQLMIWTVGHSQHPLQVFIALLKAYDIAHVADIRSFPGSKRYPHFGRHPLSEALQAAGIGYTHYPELGGRQEAEAALPYSPLHPGVQRLEHLAARCRVAYMCAEADWRNCHRAGLSDYLHHAGWKVIHIKGNGGNEEHRPVIQQGTLF